MNRPEHLSGYIDLGFDLYRHWRAGARFSLEELSCGSWACLIGAQEGFARAENKRTEQMVKKQQQQKQQRNVSY